MVSADPLKGIRVLEMAQYIAGPLAAQQLADFGAEIVKIERPDTGDPFRKYDTRGPVENYGYNYRAFNRNKLSVALDLQAPEASAVIKRLVAGVDVVIQNFRPGVLERLGIGYETLKAVNPKIIYCAIAGFADDGPNRDRPAFDTIGQAMSGMLFIFTDREDPQMRGPTIADQATALQASNAVLAALFGKRNAESGCRIDISMIDAAISFIPDVHAAHTDAGLDVYPESRAASSHAFIMRCGDDGLVAVHFGGIQQNFLRLIEALGCAELARVPVFNTRENRVANWQAFLEALKPHFRKLSRTEVLVRLHAQDIPCSEVLTIPDVVESAESRHSGIFETIDHHQAGRMTVMRRAARINRSRGMNQRPPALLGEHTEDVLRKAGFTNEEILHLRQAGVIGQELRAR